MAFDNFEDSEWTWQYDFDHEKLEERKADLETFHTGRIGFRFLDDHFGLRPGALHTLLGGSGQGKSTLTQSLVLEWTKSQPCLLYLTEEDKETVETKLSIMEPRPQYMSTKLHVVQEKDIIRGGANGSHIFHLLEMLDKKMKSSGARILVIDNLTTSAFYGFFKVNDLLEGLRKIGLRYKAPVFLLSHPKKGVNESKGLFHVDDCRGSNELGMKSDYFYGLHRHQQTMMTGTIKVGAFIYVNKSRQHSNQGCIYRLEYDGGLRRYTKDTPITFEAYKEVVKNRDKL